MFKKLQPCSQAEMDSKLQDSEWAEVENILTV